MITYKIRRKISHPIGRYMIFESVIARQSYLTLLNYTATHKLKANGVRKGENKDFHCPK